MKKAEKKVHKGSVSASSLAKLVLIGPFNELGNQANWRLEPESHGIVNAPMKPNLSSIALFTHNDAVSNRGIVVYENSAVSRFPKHRRVRPMYTKYFSLSISNSLTRFLYPTRSMIGEMAIWLSILALGWRSITFSGTFIFPARISLSLSLSLSLTLCLVFEK